MSRMLRTVIGRKINSWYLSQNPIADLRVTIFNPQTTFHGLKYTYISKLQEMTIHDKFFGVCVVFLICVCVFAPTRSLGANPCFVIQRISTIALLTVFPRTKYYLKACFLLHLCWAVDMPSAPRPPHRASCGRQ